MRNSLELNKLMRRFRIRRCNLRADKAKLLGWKPQHDAQYLLDHAAEEVYWILEHDKKAVKTTILFFGKKVCCCLGYMAAATVSNSSWC